MKTENTLRVGFPAHTDVLIDLSLGRESVCVCVWLASFNCLDLDRKIESNCI